VDLCGGATRSKCAMAMRAALTLVFAAVSLGVIACSGNESERDGEDSRRTESAANGRLRLAYGVRDCRVETPDADTPRGVDGVSCEEAREVLEQWPDFGPVASMRPCKRERGGFDHRTDGAISCAAVSRFVNEEFAPHPGGWVQQAGPVTCVVRQPGGRYGTLHVRCLEGDAQFSFKFA
jgi:hypothetical protein